MRLSLSPLYGSNFFLFKPLRFKQFIFIFLKSSEYFFFLPVFLKYLRPFYSTFSGFNLSVGGAMSNLWNIATLSSLSYFFFLRGVKFSFNGKGHKVLIGSRMTITFHFGHSHMFYVYHPTSCIKLLTKTKGYFWGLNGFLLNEPTRNLQKINPYNLYTKNGIRFRRQIIGKKIGKISLYM